MKRRLFSALLLSLALMQPACRKSSDLVTSPEEGSTEFKQINTISDKSPEICSGIAVDQSGNVWFCTTKLDTTVYVPPTSSYLPCYSQIYMYDGKNYILKYDNIKNSTILKLTFDQSGNLWLLGLKKILMINKQHRLSELLTLDKDQGLFQTIEADQQNNIWVGGYGTGLYKYSCGQWTNYTTSNSPLKSNSMTKIFADKNNTVWIALLELMGIQKFENNSWTSYSRIDSDHYLRDIWDIKTDKSGNLWAGAGWIDSDRTLFRFDGAKWTVMNPCYSSGSFVPGTIRLIQADLNGNVWTVSEVVDKYIAVKSTLSVYNAQGWSVMENAADNKIITDMKLYNNKIYLATYDKIYTVEQ